MSSSLSRTRILTALQSHQAKNLATCLPGGLVQLERHGVLTKNGLFSSKIFISEL